MFFSSIIVVLFLLPHNARTLVLLAPPGTGFSQGIDSSIETVDLDDNLDDQTWLLPINNLERQPSILELDDITLTKDILPHKHKHSKHRKHSHPRDHEGLNRRHRSIQDSQLISEHRLEPENIGSTKKVFKLFSNKFQRASHPRQPSQDSSSPHHQPSATSTSSSSSISLQKNDSRSFSSQAEGSNFNTESHVQHPSPSAEDSHLPSANIASVDSSGTRHKRWARSSNGQDNRWSLSRKRIKLSRLITMNSGIGQPIIIRSRNRVDAKVGVMIVVENSIYRQYMLDNGNNPRVALARIRRYYGMVFAMIDQRFQTIKDPGLSVTVKISGILVAETREDSSWLEHIVDWGTRSSHGRASVHTDKALKKFTKWISGRKDLPEYDHAMVFTAYRLTNKQGVGLGGMAYLNAICDTESGNAVSIVADRADFQCVKVATHELAHSLGAYHDGDFKSKSCRSDSNYIMSPLTTHENHKLKNAFYFSPCSIRDMSAHLSKPSASCVKNEPPVYYSYDLQRLPPGYLYNADMQCKMIFGKKSGFCREGNLVNIMCGQLWCRDPNKDNGCRTNSYLTALPGTECGTSKVCHLGECIHDTRKNDIQSSKPSSAINVVPSIPQPVRPSFRMRGPRSRGARRIKLRTRSGRRIRIRRRRRRNRCTADKNVSYCEGLIKLNPGGCKRRAIRQYCCRTCRRQRGRRRR